MIINPDHGSFDMATKDDIIAAMNKENTGNPPPALFSQTGTVEMMGCCGASWPDANFDIDKLIKLALQPSELFGFATVRIPFDITAEAERFGCTINPGDGGRQPAVVDSPWRGQMELQGPPDFMPIDEYLSEGRVAMYIDACNRISKEHPELFLTACMLGPVEVLGHLIGLEGLIMASFTSLNTVNSWVEKITPYQCEYAKALSEACDNIFIITEGAEDVIDPDTFGTFTPYESTVFKSIKESFSVAHVCGTTDNILEKLADIGATALSVESHGDPQSIVDRVGDRIVLVGGVDPVNTLMPGTPEQVKESARKAAEAGYDVISSECGVPPQTPNENLRALAEYDRR